MSRIYSESGDLLEAHDSHIPEDEDYEDQEENHDDDDDSDREQDDDEDEFTDSDSSESERARGENEYKTSCSKIAVKIGGTQLSFAEAKLYGLLDENGKLKNKAHHFKSQKKPQEIREHINKLSTVKIEPKDAVSLDPDSKECRFVPQKSKKAERAMMNPRCGYDFVTKLKEKGDFIQRNLEGGSRGDSKALKDAQEEDYNARLDKLQCPKCRKHQSFDEFVSMKRVCGVCQERFVKLNVSKGRAWEAKQEENEKKRREKLAKIEAEAYVQCSFAPRSNPVPPTSKRSMTLQERMQGVFSAQKEATSRLREEREAAELRLREKQLAEVSAARERAKERQRQEDLNNKVAQNATPTASSVPPAVTSGQLGNGTKNEPLEKKHKKKTTRRPTPSFSNGTAVSYDKIQGNVSEKFQMLINSDMEALQTALL